MCRECSRKEKTARMLKVWFLFSRGRSPGGGEMGVLRRSEFDNGRQSRNSSVLFRGPDDLLFTRQLVSR
jgi:hypothetical protein